MKTLSKLFLLGFLSLGLFACSDEDDPLTNTDNQIRSNDHVYMRFKVEIPLSTRSSTDNGNGKTNSNANEDYETGMDVESKVSTFQLVLVDSKNKDVISISEIGGASLSGQPDLYVASFNSKELVEYAKTPGDKNVNVIAYCNPVDPITNKVDFTINQIHEITDGKADPIWSDNHFMMTNANRNKGMNIKFPSEAELASHKSPETAFDLGNIEVERTAARFDIAKNNNEFLLKGTESSPEINIVLTDVALFNLSNQCFHLRRVSADGQNPADITTSWTGLFDTETTSNYVVDVGAKTGKNKGSFLYTSADKLEWTSLASLEKTDSWNYKGSDAEPEYYIWRYASENAIPAGVAANQNVATGVAFKAKIQAGTACPTDLAGTINQGKEPIYVYNDILYGGWDRLERAAEQGFINGSDGPKFEENTSLTAVVNALKKAVNAKYPSGGATVDQMAEVAISMNLTGLKVFIPENGIYSVYYNYYNRHNDNNDPKVSGIMEFAVVRNNVYKLRVDGVSQFGDPGWVEPDPQKPIESENIYFQVTVSILPWTVRVNHLIL